MSNADAVRNALIGIGHALCDDCLAAASNVQPRQTARSIARQLASAGELFRDEFGLCGKCHKHKQTTAARGQGGVTTSIRETPKRADTSARPWHWEGHVQAAVEAWLVGRGWTITQAVDTASKQQGTDLIASKPHRRLWVTVKGFPAQTERTYPATQARHWFSHAMFDVMIYRERDRDVEIAVALPDGKPTYLNNAGKVTWFQAAADFAYFWVDEHGGVRVDGGSRAY